MCNGLSFWIRKKPLSSSSNIHLTTDSNSNEIDSDEEDLTDDRLINSSLSQPNNSLNSISSSDSFSNSVASSNNLPSSMELDDQSTYPTDKLSTNDSYDDLILSDNFADEEQNYPSFDLIDNWSAGVIEDLDTEPGDEIQQQIGITMKKCRSIVKLMNKSSILMNRDVARKKRWRGAIVEKGHIMYFLAVSFSKKHSKKLTTFVTLGLNLCK